MANNQRIALIVFMASVLCANTACSQARQFTRHRSKGAIATTHIAAQLNYTQAYCGGAPPPPQLLKNLATPAPYANQKLYFYKNNTDIIDAPIITTVMTDEKGNFVVNLPRGNYAVRTRPNELQKMYAAANAAACREFCNKADFVINTNKPAAEYAMSLQCNPCEPPRP
jgi:hypothetical protein